MKKECIYKLYNLEFLISTLRFLYNYFQNPSAQVRVHFFLSSSFPTPAGVIQGSPLYYLFCSEIRKPIKLYTHLVRYANNTTCWVAIYSATFANSLLQNYFDPLQNWMRYWHIQPNLNKTQTIRFRHPYARASQDLKYIKVSLWKTKVQLQPSII